MADMKDFLAKLNEDKTFADEIAAVQSKEELLAKIKAAGFDVTEADLTGTGELSDDELDAVAGGDFLMDAFFPICETCGGRKSPGLGCRTCRTGTFAFFDW